jgi:hypothetical protein
MGVLHAHLGRRRVHPRNEGIQPGTVGVRQGVRRIRPRRQQQCLEQFLCREHVSRAQRRGFAAVLPGVGDRRLRYPDLLAEVAAFQDQQGGHHLGDARHRPFGVLVAAPEHLTGGRVGQHGALGPHPAGRAGHLDHRAARRWPDRRRCPGSSDRGLPGHGPRTLARGHGGPSRATADNGYRGQRNDHCPQPHHAPYSPPVPVYHKLPATPGGRIIKHPVRPAGRHLRNGDAGPEESG